jgi:hypothetical protein
MIDPYTCIARSFLPSFIEQQQAQQGFEQQGNVQYQSIPQYGVNA